ncbi:MAG: gliding motility lipoprotein GldD [Bacteroidales bacterium]|nr:gliding motility lipoprotein GldD [Bacteroidales bacterium]
MSNKLLLLFIIAVVSCDRSYVPKPDGYLKVNYPEKEYTLFKDAAPFEFEYPVYAEVVQNTSKITEPYWYDLNFPEYNGTVYLSYKKLEGNLEAYIEDTRTLVYKHTARSDGIVEIPFLDSANKRYGILYELSGNVASPVQFFLTDSTEHFLRGSLYFKTTPNRDSLNPIISFVNEDIKYMIESLKWN